ncbi:MAG: hypothetical protein CVU63_25205 [Deltaproteobacteria bacterium HGW-Deltaproteobacteria-20]|nr:MAG: hypothetical protein CVU63_25205 [Deltaproteobacteria bacterium HGW-Deltaproteobacteria-20]
MMLPGAMNTECPRIWVRESVTPALKPGDIVVWDNLDIHNDVEIAGRTATFTALRAEQPVVLVVKFDDGSELQESVVPTANAVIRVRSASAVAPSARPAVPGLPGGKPTAKPPGVRGPRFIDDPYE